MSKLQAGSVMQSRQGEQRPSETIDLTKKSPEDHMHAVAAQLWKGAIDLTEDEPVTPKRTKAGKTARFLTRPTTEDSARKQHRNSDSPLNIVPFRRPSHVFQLHPKLSQSNSTSLSLSPTPASDQSQSPKQKKKSFEPFPFMDFPPEIRNHVYRMLLVASGPIELPELTGRNGASHRARWAKCQTRRDVIMHKTIFLEILQASKQVHTEASGILYGCNVFKYRSNPRDPPRRVVLPTRHLQLLKHVKISVISRTPDTGHDEAVAGLVSEFAGEELRLETFEITWFGHRRYQLRKGSPVCQALGALDVERHFTIKVVGEARMEKAMREDLERALSSRKVEIHRPVKTTGEELSDGD